MTTKTRGNGAAKTVLPTHQETREALKGLPGWEITPEGLTKTFFEPNFRAAVALVDWIAELAESMDHHPDLNIHGYRRLTVTLMTHSGMAVTMKDFELAGMIENLGKKPED